MLAIDVIINLANIMLIFDGVIVLSSGADATAPATATGTNASASTSTFSVLAGLQQELKTMPNGGVSASGNDFLNIRHERSKQRRHATTAGEKQPTEHLNVYEARPGPTGFQLQHEIKTEQRTANNIVGNIADAEDADAAADGFDDHHLSLPTQRQLNKFSQNIHSHTNNEINAVLRSATNIYILNNVTRKLNNGNDRGLSSSRRNVTSMHEATEASLHLKPPPAAEHAATLKAVTHRIRKLHKKKIVESLRQLNIDKFNTNGGHLTKNHHRSLLEAEHLLQQQQREQTQRTEITTTAHTADGSNQQATSPDASSTHPTAKESNGNKADVAFDGVDTNESEHAFDSRNMVKVGDAKEDADDDSTSDELVAANQADDESSLLDDFYANDDNNSNLSNDESFDDDGDGDGDGDDDLLYGSTDSSLLKDDKFEKPFKNFSSEFIKDVDNSVDLEDSENETFFTTWQDIKDLHTNTLNFTNPAKSSANIFKNLTQDLLIEQTNNGSTATDLPIDLLVSSVDSLQQPLMSGNRSQVSAPAPAQRSSLYQKQEITFNDSTDLAQDAISAAAIKNMITDDAFKEENGDDEDDNSIQFSDFPLSNLDDSADETETEVTSEVASDDDTNHFLEGVVDAANSEEVYDWDEISRSNRRDLMHGRDVVTKFLQIVETQHSLGSNCEAGTSLNLGEGVVDRYAQDRFRVEAEVAVNRANMLTRLFKMTSAAAQADVNLLHASVLSMVEFDDDIFAAGNCFDWNEHPAQPGLFCPFAYRLPPPNLGAILAKDLAMEYHYLGNTSEWFFQARKNAEKVIARNEQYLKAFHLYSNKTDERIEDDTLAVKYEDGRWSKPYYDCGGGNIWMLTYTVPFFGHENSTYHFKGTSGIDIDLRRVDIDQCPQRNIPGSTKPLNIFAGTDKCKQRTTMCEAIQGLGFRRGSYKCVCRKGYYFPDTTSQHKYFNGSLLEEEYEKLMLGKNSTYNIVNEYECLPCAEGCDSCEDGSPCIAALNWPMRTSILALACVVIGLLPPAAWFTFRYQQVKVVRASSPALLRVIALGAFFIYCTNIVMYPNPNLYTCTARIWLREIGFSLTYGALMLKTWRISVIFRVRSAKAVKITDAALLKRLGCICGAIGTCLLVRTLVSPPDVVVGRTADDLKAFLCKTDWWDYTFTSMEVVFLAWGVRLCIMVRKAPSEFNESRFISMAIYNEFLLTCFLNVSMLFLQSPANPDLLYIIFFCHTQLTITLLLALIFGSKVYIVLRSGKSHQESIGMGAKSTGPKFNFRPKVRTFANPSSATTSTAPAAVTTSAETKLSDQEALEEIRQLSVQLQRIQEMAPPTGVAVMTISSLLDGLKTPTSMVMATAVAAQGAVSGISEKQLTVGRGKPEALPLLSLNEEMKKYQQLQVPQKVTATAITAATTMMLSTTTNNNVAIAKSIPAIELPSSQVSVTTTPTTPTTTTTTTNNKDLTRIGHWQEKAVNTEIIGSCVAEEKFTHWQLHEHIVCQSCYEKCKSRRDHQTASAKLDKCQILGSPQPEGSISFKNIKLDCMCSQSDDLDQLTESEQHHHTIRRITKRTAATNTPPSTTRKRAALATSLQPAGDVKAFSSVSLPSDENQGRNLPQSNSFISSPQPQQSKQHKICDNCKNRFKRKDSVGKAKAAGNRPQRQRQQQHQQQHRKLSRLSSRCNELIADIENSRAAKATTSFCTAASTRQQPQQQQQQTSYDCAEEAQYSTDDIIFYTTTDTSDNDDDDDDDDETDDEQADTNKEDDLSSILSHSKSDTRVPLKLKPHHATIEFKCISLSLGNITTSTSIATATSSTSSSTQPELIKSKAALIGANNTTIQVTATATAVDPAAASTSTSATTTQPQNPTASSSSNGGNNGKAKRPDKLVLNLNDRSKFTKEVSV